MSLFPFSRLFPTCFGPSWAHHQGYFKLLFLCYHLVHAVLCWSSACVSGLVCGGDFGVHVGKRREKGNKDIVQKVASVGNSYCNT